MVQLHDDAITIDCPPDKFPPVGYFTLFDNSASAKGEVPSPDTFRRDCRSNGMDVQAMPHYKEAWYGHVMVCLVIFSTAAGALEQKAKRVLLC